MNTHQEILEFIRTIRESFIGAEQVYTQGSCYQFYRILANRYSQAIAYDNHDHIITRIADRYYDITGEVKKTNHTPFEDKYPEVKVKDIRYVVLSGKNVLQLTE